MNGQRMSVEHRIPVGSVHSLLTEEDGVTAIEYGLVAALIAIALIGALQATGTSLGVLYGNWSSAVLAAI